ncbi:WhiB family transcriptional regulator [Rhodococcus marinonascens]|uniref:WhiB family transcriptional regulator n=1 Tax=Rhodococcus marinonascens TaxID=38311 RepID=UPI0009346186|nr:WhiB family transcriptional regulator [Rhodococcus marinonascens]
MSKWDYEDWRHEAACLVVDPELFFIEKDDEDRHQKKLAAQQICASCPVEPQCRDFAANTGQEYGIWGGQGMGRIPKAERTHCNHGHALEGNVHISPEGRRRCKTCMKQQNDQALQRKRELRTRKAVSA